MSPTFRVWITVVEWERADSIMVFPSEGACLIPGQGIMSKISLATMTTYHSRNPFKHWSATRGSPGFIMRQTTTFASYV
jgi:hypothetical protein